MNNKNSDLERFWSKVEKSSDGCWYWTASRYPSGYGQFWTGERTTEGHPKCVPAHRTSWTIAYGPIPEGMDVLHSCHNPPCVRPWHLKLGTAQDNADDMMLAGRYILPRTAASGSENGNSHLTWEQRVEINFLYNIRGVSCKELVTKFNVSLSTIQRQIRKNYSMDDFRQSLVEEFGLPSRAE